VTQRRRCF